MGCRRWLSFGGFLLCSASKLGAPLVSDTEQFGETAEIHVGDDHTQFLILLYYLGVDRDVC